MIDPLVSGAVAAGLALLLLVASWHKVTARDEFVAALRDYRLLPAVLLRPVARLLPLIEFALAVGWLTGVARPAVAVSTVLLLLVYAGAVAVNLLRGRVHIACGCGLGGAQHGDARLSWWLVARNAVLAGAAGVAALPASQRGLGAMDWLALVLATLAAILLYAAASQLMRNGAAIAAWRTRRD
jgi:hypothetical protein